MKIPVQEYARISIGGEASRDLVAASESVDWDRASASSRRGSYDACPTPPTDAACSSS